MTTLGAYGYLLWGNMFDIPYRESILSVLPIVDEFTIVTDRRFNDGTIESLKLLTNEYNKIKLIIAEIDLANPGVDGATKALARRHCNSDILLQIDLDEVLREQDYLKISKLVENWNLHDRIIGTGVVQ